MSLAIYAKFGVTRTQSAENSEKRGEPSTESVVGKLGIDIGLGSPLVSESSDSGDSRRISTCVAPLPLPYFFGALLASMERNPCN